MTTIVPTCRWLNINKNSFTDVAFNIGQCITDSMSISSPGAHGSPAICATNSGYHSKYDSIPMHCGPIPGESFSKILRLWHL